MIPIKTASEIKIMRQAGRITAKTLDALRAKVQPGISTQEIDQLAKHLIEEQGGVPAFKDYRGFPANICTSVNEEVVHGIPGERKLISGDIISIDVGVGLDGYFADATVTLAVGKIEGKLKELLSITHEALHLGIKQARCKNKLFDISWAIQSFVESRRCSVVRDFVGHGIGKKLHEPPEIPNFGKAHTGPVLEEGMVLAIEPMVNLGSWEILFRDNGWTAVTKDGLPSAHFEHTVAITQDGPEVLTR